ncbi:ATP-binding protein [Belliella kenyensis]|uniref:ATP-binding protein n=1 Tax=Belliella kenyensis TaxID=1472724 RepID=A0ABV8EJD0_9BACT|nr:ATP-binding protein [Belliella kenyensis]MCH7401385.1 ATP-binding protein [Belliella kenyensis]MDN3602828.1 ATP-binding protein [Belliella kenyensis]
MKKPDNPFILNTYHGKAYFCDREEDLIRLEEHIRNGRNIVLYAWRRLGKSALVHRFFEELESSGDYETVYVDFLGAISMDDAVNELAKAIFERFGKTKTGLHATIQKMISSIGATVGFDPISGTPTLNIGVNSSPKEEQSLHALGEFLNERKKKIVVAIDEFQQVSTYNESNAEAIFRAWTQKFPSIRFIFSGSHRGMMTEMFLEKNRPFYHSAQLLSLNPIPAEKYIPFIQGHFQAKKKSISEEIIHSIIHWARGQTYTIQLICNYLYSQCQEVKLTDVERVKADILGQQQAIFANFPKMLTKTQWKVFQAIAKEEPLQNPLSKDFINKYRLGATSSVSTAIKSLQKQELVVVDDDIYLVHEVLLARWMARL